MLKRRSGRACPCNRSAVAPAGVPEHRSGRVCSCNRSVVALAGVPEHQSKRGYPRKRSAVAPTGVPKHQQECRSTNRTSTHSFFGPRWSYDHMSFRTHNLSLLPSVFMTYCFSCSCSCFSSFSYFIYLYRNTDVFTHHSCIIVHKCIYFS